MPEFCKDFTWLYFPDRNVPFYRITFLSRYGELTPDNNKYWSVLCECARSSDDDVNYFYLFKKNYKFKKQIIFV